MQSTAQRLQKAGLPPEGICAIQSEFDRCSRKTGLTLINMSKPSLSIPTISCAWPCLTLSPSKLHAVGGLARISRRDKIGDRRRGNGCFAALRAQGESSLDHTWELDQGNPTGGSQQTDGLSCTSCWR